MTTLRRKASAWGREEQFRPDGRRFLVKRGKEIRTTPKLPRTITLPGVYNNINSYNLSTMHDSIEASGNTIPDLEAFYANATPQQMLIQNPHLSVSTRHVACTLLTT